MVKIIDALQPLSVPIADLTLDPANARSHDQRNIDAIKASLTRFGQRFPVVVQKEGMIVRAGNGRVTAARELGWTEIAAVIVDESNLDAASFALADNRTTELASWDNDALRQILAALQADDEIPIGWDDDELAQLLDGSATVAQNRGRIRV